MATIITDVFNRTTSGVLGSAVTGQVWQSVRGTWFSTGTQARSDSGAANYPIAAVNLSIPDAITSASVTAGTGVAFWVTDSGNWWASTAKAAQESYSYNCNPYNYWVNRCQVVCNGGNFYSGNYALEYSYRTCQSWANSRCSGTMQTNLGGYMDGPYTGYNTCTGYNNLYYLSLIKSVAGTVSNVIADTTLASMPAAIKVTTVGDTITAQAYSDTALTTTLGSAVVTTPTSPTRGNSTGVIIAPSAYNQNNVLGNFYSRAD